MGHMCIVHQHMCCVRWPIRRSQSFSRLYPFSASCCVNGSRYQNDKKNHWRYDAFIATPELGDVRINMFTFGANTASVEDGIYLLDARTTIGPIIDNKGKSAHSLYLFTNDVHEFSASSSPRSQTKLHLHHSTKPLGGEGISAKRARTRNCTASQIRQSPTTQYIRRPLHSPHPLCFPSKSFIVDSKSKTVSSATRTCNHINGCQGLTLAGTVLDL